MTPHQGKAGFFTQIFKMVFLEILASTKQVGFHSDSHIHTMYIVRSYAVATYICFHDVVT